MTAFRHKCETKGCWLEQRWDSNDLGRALADEEGRWPFPRRSSPTDVDAAMDCRGEEQILIETKGAGVPLGAAQRIFLEGMSRRGVTVMVQECDPPNEDAVTRVQFCIDGEWTDWIDCDRVQRDRYVQRWFARAEKDINERNWRRAA